MDSDRLSAALVPHLWREAFIQLCTSSRPDITKQTIPLETLQSRDLFPTPSYTKAAFLRSYPLQRSLDSNALPPTGFAWSYFLLGSPFHGFVPMTAGVSSAMLPVLTPSHGAVRLPERFATIICTLMLRWVSLAKDQLDFVFFGLSFWLSLLFRGVGSTLALACAFRLFVFCLLSRLFVCLFVCLTVVSCCPVPLSLSLGRTSVT